MWYFDFIKIPLCFDFLGIGFSGNTSIAEHFIKSPVNATLPFEPLYTWKTLDFKIPQLSVGLKTVLFCIICYNKIKIYFDFFLKKRIELFWIVCKTKFCFLKKEKFIKSSKKSKIMKKS